MYQRNRRQDLTHLVSLEVADHVPVDLRGQVGFRRRLLDIFLDLGGNFLQLLHPVLPQVVISKLDHFLNLFELGGFGHDDQTNVLRLPAHPGAGFRDDSFDPFDSFCDLRHVMKR